MVKRAPRAVCVQSLSFPRPLCAKLLSGFFDFAHHHASLNVFGVDHRGTSLGVDHTGRKW